MSLLHVPELPTRVDALERRLAALEGREPIVPDTIAVPNVYYVTPEGTKKEGEAGGMIWTGPWDRESGYELQDVVRFKGKTYVCIEPVNAIAGLLGEGPPPTGSPVTNFELPAGKKVAPLGQLISGEEVGGSLTRHSAELTNSNFFPFTGWRADVWQVMLTKEAVEEPVTFTGFPEGGLPGTLGSFRVYGADDSGRQRTLSGSGAFAKGEFKEAEWHKAFPLAQEIGGAYRIYIVVYGGVWEHTVAGKSVIQSTLPLPYSFTATGTGIQSSAGNPSPAVDFEHWSLVAGA